MKPNRKAMLVGWLIALSAGWAAAQEPHSPPDPKVTIGATPVKLPLEFLGGRPVVLAKLNGKGPFRFYFDTGASGCIIGLNASREAGLDVIGPAGVRSGGDAPNSEPIKAEAVSVDALELGSAKITDLIMVAMDRPQLGTANPPVGVLSPAILIGCKVTIDYPGKSLIIERGELPKADGRTVFAFSETDRIASLPVSIAGTELWAHLDSGSGAGISLPMSFSKKLALEGEPRDTGRKFRTVRGEFPVIEGKLKGTVTIGKLTFENPTVQFSDAVRGVNVGGKILERCMVTIDSANRRLRIQESPTPAK